MQLEVKNWRRFQRRLRHPYLAPWIKLYRTLLTDYEFLRLDPADRGRLVLLWLVADREGQVPGDERFLRSLLHDPSFELRRFLDAGWLLPVSTRKAAKLKPR